MLVPFDLPPGLNSDDTTFAAEGRWADGNNVRFYQGRAQPIGGWINHPDQVGTLTGIPRNIIVHNAGTYTGTASKLYSGTGTDVSPVGLGSGYTAWAFAAWGDDVLAVPSGGTLYTSASPFTEVTQAPNAITWMLTTPERQVLALGCNEEVSGTFNGRCIRGSDIEDKTDWTTTASNNVFEHILEGTEDIVTGRILGSYVAVWTVGDLWLGQFQGDPGQTYRFDRVDDKSGCIGPNAATVVGGAAWYVGRDRRLRVWYPGSRPAVIDCPIFKDFSDNLDRGDAHKIIVAHNSRFDEIWVWYPDSRDATNECTRYIAYSIGESAKAQRPVWFRGQIARTAVLDSPSLQKEFYEGVGIYASVLAADSSGNLFVHEYGTASTNRTWYIESAGQYIDNSRRRMMIRGIVPDFEDQTADVSGAITLTLTVRDRPQSTATTKGPHTLSATATKKDFRASGKIMTAKVSGVAGTYARFGKPLFDMVPLGER